MLRRARSVARQAGLLPRTGGGIGYWQERAQTLGKRAVFNVGHEASAIDKVTALQRVELFPHFTACLRGWEHTVLDFGCGSGRFTADLARLVGGKAIGVDPIKRLLDLAPRSPHVRYELMGEDCVPLADESVDVIWICLVLGCIREPVLHHCLAELERLLRPDGLVFLVENTTPVEASPEAACVFRSIEDYRRRMPFVTLHHLGDYYDLGERISIMSGRKVTSLCSPIAPTV